MARVQLHFIPLLVDLTIGLMEMDMICHSLLNSETLELMVSFFQKIKLFQTPKRTWKAFALLSTISRELLWRQRATFNLNFRGGISYDCQDCSDDATCVFNDAARGVAHILFPFLLQPFLF